MLINRGIYTVEQGLAFLGSELKVCTIPTS